MSNNNTNKLAEPKVKGKPISYVKTQESLEEARNRYREKSDGLFDYSLISGSKFNSHIRHLKGCCDDIAKDNLEEKMFGQEEYEDTIKALSLPGVVFYGYFTWRGEGGNYRSDPRFDAEETYDETEETKLRAEFIDALFKYATTAAAKADKLGNKTVKQQFMSVLPKLKDMKSSDPEAPWSNNDAKVVANAIFEASEGLWAEWQVVLIKRGDILDEREIARLYNEIHKILIEIDEYFKETQAKIDEELIIKKKQEMAQAAIKKICYRAQAELLPLAIRYGKAEEAQIFDESYITEALIKLCRHYFVENKEGYNAALRYVDDIAKAFHHPVTVYSEGVWDITPKKKEEKEYIIEPMIRLAEFVEGKPFYEFMEGLKKEIIETIRSTLNGDESGNRYVKIVYLIRRVKEEYKGESKIKTWKDALDFVRSECPNDDPYYSECEKARNLCKDIAKGKNKAATYEENLKGVWATCYKYAIRKDWPPKTWRRRKKNKNCAPGPCAILDRGVENM